MAEVIVLRHHPDGDVGGLHTLPDGDLLAPKAAGMMTSRLNGS